MIIRLTCSEPRHGALIERPIENTATDKDTPLEEANRSIADRMANEIIEAHRASYGAGCRAKIMVEVIDTEDSVVLLTLKRTIHRGGGGSGQPPQLMGVFYDESAAQQYIETYVAMGYNPVGDEVRPDDFTLSRQVVTQYLHCEIDDVPNEQTVTDEPEPVAAGAGG
jgi:hypothetical protein